MFGMLQVPAFLGASDSPQAALAGAVICLSACVGYCIYSVLFPGLQKRKIDAARRKVGAVLCSALIPSTTCHCQCAVCRTPAPGFFLCDLFFSAVHH